MLSFDLDYTVKLLFIEHTEYGISLCLFYKQITKGLVKWPYTKYLNDRRLVKVLNRLNDRQSNLFGSWAKWRSD